MWFYKFCLKFFDEVTAEPNILEGVVVGETIDEALKNLSDYCGETNIEEVRIALLGDGLLTSGGGVLGMKIQMGEEEEKTTETRSIEQLFF